MGWLAGWPYRKSITLSRASGAVTDYQMKLLLGESSGATGEAVDCGGKCLSNFNDIRFTTSDGITQLPYWIESLSGSSPNQLATIWIKFNSIGTSATTFYMYYGNPIGSVYSNGVNSFQLFDDFLGSSLDTDKWSLVEDPTVTVSGGSVTVASGVGGHYVKSKTFTATAAQSAIRGKITVQDSSNHLTSAWGFGWYSYPSNTNYIIRSTYSSAAQTFAIYSNDGSGRVIGTATAEDYAQHTMDMLFGADNLVQLYRDGTQVSSNITTKIPTGDMFVSFGTHYTNVSYVFTIVIDWILVRQYLSTEPAWGSWGDEEVNLSCKLMINNSLKVGAPNYIKVNGIWKPISDGKIFVNGMWKELK